ncbi:MAG: diaminopimelate decarboxylase [Thermoflexales bacterium]|nr:diaminopimelate decarboxylase [Thermoflexales bacterium]
MSFHVENGAWWCEDIAIHDLADQFGTPLYVYSRAQLEANYRRVADAFAPLNARLHFSVKSNANGVLLGLLRELGCGFDVVSGGELFRALHAGASPASIVFAGVGKTRAELEYAIDQGVGWINVESSQELDVLEEVAKTRPCHSSIALRVNPSVEADTHHHIATGGHRSKFGIDVNEARSILENAQCYPHLDIAGLHIHIGSQLATPDGTVAAIERILPLTEVHPIRSLDLGGGFPAAYRPTDQFPEPAAFAEKIIHLLKDRLFEIAIEPGRSISANAGALIATVQYIKPRDGRRIVVVDASMTELIRPALYEAYHHIEAVNRGEVAAELADIVGPVCESADVLGTDRALPVLERGDRLIVFNAGAYGMSMASNYNSRPRPAEVLIEGATPRLIRRRETWADLIELEQAA